MQCVASLPYRFQAPQRCWGEVAGEVCSPLPIRQAAIACVRIRRFHGAWTRAAWARAPGREAQEAREGAGRAQSMGGARNTGSRGEAPAGTSGNIHAQRYEASDQDENQVTSDVLRRKTTQKCVKICRLCITALFVWVSLRGASLAVYFLDLSLQVAPPANSYLTTGSAYPYAGRRRRPATGPILRRPFQPGSGRRGRTGHKPRRANERSRSEVGRARSKGSNNAGIRRWLYTEDQCLRAAETVVRTAADVATSPMWCARHRAPCAAMPHSPGQPSATRSQPWRTLHPVHSVFLR